MLLPIETSNPGTDKPTTSKAATGIGSAPHGQVDTTVAAMLRIVHESSSLKEKSNAVEIFEAISTQTAIPPPTPENPKTTNILKQNPRVLQSPQARKT